MREWERGGSYRAEENTSVTSRSRTYVPIYTYYTRIPRLARVSIGNVGSSRSLARPSLLRSFETSNGISHQETGQPKNVDNETPVVSQGSDSYTAPDGQQVSITYIADENGFQVQGSHIPTAPPIPPEIQRALEWNAAHPEEDDGGQRPPGRGEGDPRSLPIK